MTTHCQANVQSSEPISDGLPRRARRQGADTRRELPGQGSLFNLMPAASEIERPDPLVAEVLAELRSQDTTRLTPLDALNLMARWQERLKRE